MKITLTQSDITQAIRAHIASQGFSLNGKTVSVDFATTRDGRSGPHSTVAHVDIEDAAALPELHDFGRPQLRSATVVPLAQPAESPAPVAEAPQPAEESAEAETSENAGKPSTVSIFG
jgi:hypothetical protein